MHYTSHWRLSFLLALVVHFVFWSGATFALPMLLPKPEIADIGMPIEIEDITLDSDSEFAEANETVPSLDDGVDKGFSEEKGDMVPAEKVAALASVLESVPKDVNVRISREAPGVNQGAVAEADITPKPEKETEKEEKKPEEEAPVIVANEAEAIAQLKEQIKAAEKDSEKSVNAIVVRRKGTGGKMGQPARLIIDSYPATGVNFRGRVSVFATIAKDGTIRSTKVAVTSGRRSIDEIAMAACRRWRFKPALDHEGQPMECIQVISIPFNVPNIDRQVLERYRAQKEARKRGNP